jgi:hypothetical protein
MRDYKKNLGWFLRAKNKVVKDACEARRTVGSLKMSVGSTEMHVKHDKLWEAPKCAREARRTVGSMKRFMGSTEMCL